MIIKSLFMLSIVLNCYQLAYVDKYFMFSFWLILIFALLITEKALTTKYRVISLTSVTIVIAIFQLFNIELFFLVPIISLLLCLVLNTYNPKKYNQLALFCSIVFMLFAINSTFGVVNLTLNKISVFLSSIPKFLGLSYTSLGQSGSGLMVTITFLLLSFNKNVINKKEIILINLILQLTYYFIIPYILPETYAGLYLMIYQVTFLFIVIMINNSFAKVEAQNNDYSIKLHFTTKHILLFLSTVVVFSVCFVGIKSNNKDLNERNITIIYTEKSADVLTVPNRGTYGFLNTGMYGSMIKELSKKNIVETQLLSNFDEKKVNKSDFVFIILPTDYLSENEKESLDRYMKNGGNIILLGDHTNIFNSQGIINDFISAYGVEINFDSGLPIRSDRIMCFENTPFTRNFFSRKLDLALQYSYMTGASLDIKGTADILISLRHGFQDMGDIENDGRGAYLGDYMWNWRNEKYGDIVLACKKNVGNGSLTIFGDTSVFQTISVVTSNSVQYLLDYIDDFSMDGIFFALFALVCFALLQKINKHYLMARTAFKVMMVLLLTALISISKYDIRIYQSELLKSMAINLEKSVDYSCTLWDDNSLTGLAFAFYRSGYSTRFSFNDIDYNDDVIYLANSNKYSDSDYRKYRKWVEDGGVLIVSAEEPSNSFLSNFGINVRNVPLGDWPNYADYESDIGFPIFYNCWELSIDDDVICEKTVKAIDRNNNEYLLIAIRNIGKGSIIVFGDNTIIKNKNLEGEDVWNIQNIVFLENLIDSLN